MWSWRDTLVIDFNWRQGNSYRLLDGTVQGIEILRVVNSSYEDRVFLSAEIFSQLISMEIPSQNYPWGDLQFVIQGDGEDINFDAVPTTATFRVTLEGSFGDITVANNPANYVDRGYDDYFFYINGTFSSLSLGDDSDWVRISGERDLTIAAGDGDDRIQIDQGRALTGTIDGGDGTDTLDVSRLGFVDLSGLSLVDIENVYFGSTTIILTEEQNAALSLDGSGSVFTRVGDSIVGTSANDSYNGQGQGSFEGGGGDDWISHVRTAVFSGNFAEYDYDAGYSFQIQQAAGSLLDGTDTLEGVLELRFADTTVQIDDAFNDPWMFLGGSGDLETRLANLAEVSYDKRFTGKFDYDYDSDVFTSTLAPNSPLVIEASTTNGSGWTFEFYDADTGQQIQFESQVYGWVYSAYYHWMDPDAKWLPVVYQNGERVPYEGGQVVLRLSGGSGIEDYAFTLKYLDDYAGSIDTLGEMDPLEGEIKGYIGDINDQDWIRTELIAGTRYEFRLEGVSSGGGTLADPKLVLLDSQGRQVVVGLDQDTNSVGTDDVIIFRPTETGTYYLAVSDVAEINVGSWTLSQRSLDTIADNVSTTERIEWNSSRQFTFTSEVNELTDRDWVKVWLDKGITYVFRLGGDGAGGTLADPQLSLRSVTGILLAQDDNSGTGTEAQLVYSVSESGWYYLDAGASGNTSKGVYVLRGSSIEDDYANTILTEGHVSVGEPESGLVTYLGDSDWFSVGLSAGVTYIIDVKGDISDGAQLDPLTDPMLIIRDESGRVVARFDDFGGSLDARAFFTPTENGLYFLEARSAYRFDIGAYTVAVNLAPPDDHASELGEDATLFTLGEAVRAEIGAPGDRDVFILELEEGRVYQLRASGLAGSGGSLIDPYLRVFDDNGNLVGFNNDGGSGNDAAFFFVPKKGGSYYVVVSSDDTKGMGTYTLEVDQRNLPPDDVGNNLSTETELTPGETFNGTLLTQNDEDWFRIELEEGVSYVFRARASASGNGSLGDPVLEIRSSTGELLDSVDNMLTSNEPVFAFTPPESGEYYLVVRASDGTTDTGSYTLITRAPDDHGNTKDSATELTLGETLSGGVQWNEGSFGVRAIDSEGLRTDFDQDWFSFSGTEGQVLSVSLVIADGSALSRPMIEVVDSQGRLLAQGDGLETDNGSAVAAFRVPSDGTYYARVIDGAGATGSYEIKLEEGDDSDEDANGSATLVFTDADGVSQASSVATIGLTGDQDTFSITLEEGHSYRIETLPYRDGSTAPLATATLALEWLAEGAESPETIEVEGELTRPSFFESASFTANSSGVLTITVAPQDQTQTGQYVVRVIDLGAELTDDRADDISDYESAGHEILAINENASGRIDSPDDKDLFAVNLTPGNIYDFSIKSFGDGLGTLAEGELRILNESGQLVSVGRFDPETGRTELSIAVFEEGRYFLEVSAAALPGNTGTYSLDTRLRGFDDNPDDDMTSDTQSGVEAGPGRPATGEIEVAGDSDWVKVTLEAGRVYVLDVLADGDGGGGTLTDSNLRLINANGEELASDDNSGAGLDSHIQFTATESGDFYLEVSGKGGATGTYTVRVRELYSGVADPLVGSQWYLSASNIDELDGQITGAGVTVGVVDDGIDGVHPDLMENMNFALAYDTQFDTKDGSPKYPPLVGPPDNHGTQVAGIIGSVQNNETGIRGVAPDVELVSTRVKWTWDQMIQALSLQWQFDVSNNSWGAIEPFSDNFNSTSTVMGWLALRRGVEDGREGLGTVFVFSAGNSAALGDNTNYHNFQNAREVITVGAVDSEGAAASFTTPGASVLVSSYGVDLITTDRVGKEGVSGGNYTEMSGTSAAAPMVSGIVALMLEANPNLGYRDVQKILAYSAMHPESQDWKENGASDFNLGGLRYNDQSGFGVVDAYAAVQLARTWTETSTAINEVSASARQFGMVAAIPDGDGESYTMTFEIDSSMSVEHVELGIDLRHQRLGDLIITLTSPSGTTSVLMNRPTVNDEQPFGLYGADSGVPTHLLWDFSSVQFWGEQATGTWTITITDVRAEQTGQVASLSLRIYGERDDGNDTFVFTDEGFETSDEKLLEDDSGYDAVNASAVRYDLYINLSEGIIAGNSVGHSIASWTVIERAYSGKGDDRLVGNDEDNYLDSGAGNDVLEGGVGDDILIGGQGSDTAVYSGNLEEYSVSWNPDTETITVVDNKTSNGDDGTDTLTGIERLVFADGEMSLSEMVGNRPPVANSNFFDQPVTLSAGMGIDFSLPENAFSDPDGETAKQLQLSLTMADGSELPDWIAFEKETGTFTGVPPKAFLGRLELLITAADEFGESVDGELVLQFGENQAPILDQPFELVLQEDAPLTLLGLSVPYDPEGESVTITITEVPGFGRILDKNGQQVAVGTSMTADELSELHFEPSENDNGNAGYLRYTATDETGTTASSSVHLFVDSVNDAPSFATEGSKLIVNYPDQSIVQLDLLAPQDPEENIESVFLVDLPKLGLVTLDQQPVSIGQELSIAELGRLEFSLNQNVNGPVGGVTIQAVDSQGLATNWTLEIVINGDESSLQGSQGNDELYGSTGVDTLYGKGGDDLLVGNAGNDNLYAGIGNDSVFGGEGNDSIDGSAGNDYLDGGPGGDILLGGPGDDVYIVDSPNDLVLEVISGGAGGTDLVVTSISMTAPENVENLEAAVGLAIDLLGNELDNVLVGNEQSNRLSGFSGRDYLFGEDGNDILDGGEGIDTMAGGLGDDIYYVDSRADRVLEQVSQGIDHVFANSSFTLPSNVENLTLMGTGNFTAGGNSLDNHLIGNSGNNVLAGGLGSDILEGGLGDDTYVLNDVGDVIVDTGGVDTIRSSLDIELPAGIENGQLVGIANNTITGNQLNNELVGNLGDNTLDGGPGTDRLIGGLGADQFVISYNGEGVEADVIVDFEPGNDLIVIDLASFGVDVEELGLPGSGLISADSFVKGAGAVALDANDHWILDTAQGILYFDPDGSGEEEMIEILKFEEGTDYSDFDSGDVFIAI